MANRLFNIAAICSAIACLLVTAACFVAGRVDPVKQFVTLRRDLQVSIGGRPYGPALEVFNNPDYGPYRGSIISVSSPGRPSDVESRGVDFIGVYYRHFRWPDATTLWTLSVSLVYLAVVSAILPSVWLIRRSRRARRAVEGKEKGVTSGKEKGVTSDILGKKKGSLLIYYEK